MDNQDRLGKKAMGYYSIGMILYLVCQWLITVIVVRVGDYGMAGNLSLAIAVSNPFSSIALYGMRTYQISDLHNKYTPQIYIGSRIVTCIISIIMCFGFISFNQYSTPQLISIILYMFFRIIEAVIDVFQGIEQKAWQLDIIGKSFILRGLGTIVTFTLLLIMTNNLGIALLGMVLSSLIILILYDFYHIKKHTNIIPEFNIEKIKKILMDCFPLTLSTFMTTAMMTIPRFFLEGYYGSDVLGIYASIAAPTIIIQTVASFIFTPLIPIMTDDYLTGKSKEFLNRIKSILWWILGLMLISIFGGIVFGKLGLRILFGADIIEYSYLLVPMIIYANLVALACFLSNILIIMRSFRQLCIGNFISMMLCAILSISIIREYGMNGANSVTIMACLLQNILFIIFIKNNIQKTRII